MKSLHIFLITVTALGLLLAASDLISDGLLLILLLALFAIGGERTVRAIKKGN